jgi:hypothetical protein
LQGAFAGFAPLQLELAPGKVIDTFAYNGTVPGPALRLREGRHVSIDAFIQGYRGSNAAG